MKTNKIICLIGRGHFTKKVNQFPSDDIPPVLINFIHKRRLQ